MDCHGERSHEIKKFRKFHTGMSFNFGKLWAELNRNINEPGRESNAKHFKLFRRNYSGYGKKTADSTDGLYELIVLQQNIKNLAPAECTNFFHFRG